MARRIRLSEAAYERLLAHKHEDEPLSDVVCRLAGERSLLELAGTLTDEHATGLETAINERRARRHDDLEKLADRLTE